jgi:hypothetical protein
MASDGTQHAGFLGLQIRDDGSVYWPSLFVPPYHLPFPFVFHSISQTFSNHPDGRDSSTNQTPYGLIL